MEAIAIKNYYHEQEETLFALMDLLDKKKMDSQSKAPQFKPIVGVNTKSLQRAKRVRLAKGRC